MREYETVVIVDPGAPESYLKELEERTSKLVETHKGQILITRPWGKRMLAYPIQKKKEGHYIHFDYAGETTLVAALERSLRLDERVLRFLTVQVNETVDIAARKSELLKTVEVAHA